MTEGLNLGTAGVKTDAEGWIVTDEYQRTNVRSVMAIGDVTGNALLAHHLCETMEAMLPFPHEATAPLTPRSGAMIMPPSSGRKTTVVEPSFVPARAMWVCESMSPGMT